jgi:hypothetical protein
MLATDANFHTGAGFVTGIGSHFHQLADAFGFQYLDPQVEPLNFSVLSQHH